jgi:catechol 2,3-dioxygenase
VIVADNSLAPALEYGAAPQGHRLPAATRLGPVRLQVASVARSLPFYRDGLGLRVLGKADGETLLVPHGEDTPLVTLRESPGALPARARGQLGLYHFALLLPDRAALGRFVAYLADRNESAGASDHQVSEALYLRDPDGLGIEVYADRPRAEWAVRQTAQGREIAMATEPLDLDALVRAAGAERWSGMPAGTVVGHVHLHAGDLDQARAFYHHALGLDAVVWSYPGALFLSAGGYHHHLGLNTWAGPGAVPPAPESARLLEWTMVLPSPADVAAAASGVEEAGYAVRRAPDGWRTDDPWGTTLHVTSTG